MQKTATRIFIGASIAFGVIGIVMILLGGPDGVGPVREAISKLFFSSIFVVLSSFALSVAGKYLTK